MKIALAQISTHIANFDLNKAKIIRYIKEAEGQQSELIVFPELSVCGYPPGDFLGFDSFIDECEAAVREIASHCIKIGAIVGAPYRNTRGKGKKLFNAAYFLHNGTIEKVVFKSLLPNYDIFDEYRYFEPNIEFRILPFKGHRIALTICEDIWNIYTPFYTFTPMDELIKQQPDLMINISASPFSYNHKQKREEVLKKNAMKYRLPVMLVNQTGAQTDIIFDGGSTVIGPNGNIIGQLELFNEDMRYFELKEMMTSDSVQEEILPISKTELIYRALLLGIRDYFGKLGLQKAIIGLSGGIDSAVVLVLLQQALGKENVKALLLPSMFSSEHSITDAVELAKNLGVAYEIIRISEVFGQFEESLEPYFKGTEFNIAEENLQSRIRATLLMAFSNKFGHVLINTSNKSEMSVGYGTLYGDMCGGLSVLGDLYKTEIYQLADFFNKNEVVIPRNIIEKAPSAELKPDQKDTDSLPPYDVLDPILYQYIDLQVSAPEIIALGFDAEIVNRVIRMVNANEFKRFQAPPVLRVSDKAFGIGRRMPIVAKY
jgi:NAD+ synthase (glutamine-hydrolysing)